MLGNIRAPEGALALASTLAGQFAWVEVFLSATSRACLAALRHAAANDNSWVALRAQPERRAALTMSNSWTIAVA